MLKKPNLFNALNYSLPTSTSRSRLFVPTLGSIEAFAFWFGFVLFLTLYGVLIQFDRIHSVQDFSALFFDFFLIQFLVVFSIIGYTHLSIASYQSLSILQQSKRIAFTTLFFTPLATLLGKWIEITLGFSDIVVENILMRAVVNTLLATMLMPLLLYYFAWQYAKILSSQQRYHQKLITQNTQLKARITPYFFFNVLNTLQYLIQTDPVKSNELLQSIAKLYRVSFYEPTKIGLSEEIGLCEHYLKVESYRFGDKLQVSWQLPELETLENMSIPSLMIQMTIEKLILALVETMTQSMALSIKITWQHNWVTVVVTTDMSKFPKPKEQTIDQMTRQITHHRLTDNPENLLNHPPMTNHITYDAPFSHAHTDTSLPPTLDFSLQRATLHQFYGDTASIETLITSKGAAKCP